MNRFDTYSDLPARVKGNVVVIGNFDGVHKGHQALLNQARSIADDLGVKCVIVTFSPHPRQIFNPNDAAFRLTNKDLKTQDLISHGVDFIISINFDTAFSQKPAEDFIQDVLVDGLAARHIVVGDDFIFGKGRGGSIETLKADDRFDVTAIAQIKTQAQAIYGSSLIRNALKIGDMETAANHLGQYWTTQSIVIHGDKRGREIGYPTANMRLNSCGDFIHPALGVYAVRVKTDNGDWMNGVANFGIRPMFETKTPLFEIHIFDFTGDLYDQVLTVEWIAHLRGEMKFDHIDDLVCQMDKDSITAKNILKNI